MLISGVCQRCISKAAKKTPRRGRHWVKWTSADTFQWFDGKVGCPKKDGHGNYLQAQVLGAPPPWCEHGLEHAVIFARTKRYRLKEAKEIKNSMKQKRG